MAMNTIAAKCSQRVWFKFFMDLAPTVKMDEMTFPEKKACI
jgi:hypothetical protein